MPLPNENTVPSPRAVASRALILHYEIERVAFAAVTGLMALFSDIASDEEKAEFAEGIDELGSVTIELLKDLRLWNQLTPRERRVFESKPDAIREDDRELVRQEKEALACLTWALGRMAELPGADEATDGSALAQTFAADDDGSLIVAFLEQAALRPDWEITAARDAVAARVRTASEPSAVLATRLKALDWMCGSLSLADWDEGQPEDL